MRETWLIYKALLSGVDVTTSYNYNKNKTFLNILAKFSLEKSISILKQVVASLFLMALGLLFSTNIFSSLEGMPAVFKLSLYLLIPAIILLTSGLIYVKEFIFGTKENAFLLSLPFSAKHIMWGRLLFMVLENATSVFLMFLVGWGVLIYRAEFLLTDPITYLALIGGLLVFLSEIILISVVFLTIAGIFAKFNKKTLFGKILNWLTIAISLSMSLVFILSNSGGRIGSVFQEQMAMWMQKMQVFYPYYFYNLALNVFDATKGISFFWLGIFVVSVLGLIIFFGILADYIAMPFIQSQQISDSSLNLSSKTGYFAKAKKSKMTSNLEIEKSAFSALYRTNKIQFSQSSNFSMQLWFIPHLTTLMMLIGVGVGFYKNAQGDLDAIFVKIGLTGSYNNLYFKLSSILREAQSEGFILLMLASVLTFLFWMIQSTASSYIFSKDGLNLVYFKALPVSTYEIYLSRIKFAFYHMLYVLILPLIALLVFIFAGAVSFSLITFFKILSFIIFNLTVIPLLDLKYKLLNWDSDAKIFKRKSYLLNMVAAIVIFVLPLALFWYIVFGLNSLSSFLVLGISLGYDILVSLILVASAYKLIPKFLQEVNV